MRILLVCCGCTDMTHHLRIAPSIRSTASLSVPIPVYFHVVYHQLPLSTSLSLFHPALKIITYTDRHVQRQAYMRRSSDIVSCECYLCTCVCVCMCVCVCACAVLCIFI